MKDDGGGFYEFLKIVKNFVVEITFFLSGVTLMAPIIVDKIKLLKGFVWALWN